MTTREQKAEDYRLTIIKFNDDYKNGLIKISYAKYLAKYKRMASKWNQMIRPPGLSERMKDFGAKSIRRKGYTAVYTYVGKHFTIHYAEEACETVWWEAWHFEEGTPEWLHEILEDWNMHDTKQQCLSFLFQTDQAREIELNQK